MRKTLMILIPLLALLFLAGCELNDNNPEAHRTSERYGVSRFENEEVVCYIADMQGGISCQFKAKDTIETGRMPTDEEVMSGASGE